MGGLRSEPDHGGPGTAPAGSAAAVPRLEVQEHAVGGNEAACAIASTVRRSFSIELTEPTIHTGSATSTRHTSNESGDRRLQLFLLPCQQKREQAG